MEKKPNYIEIELHQEKLSSRQKEVKDLFSINKKINKSTNLQLLKLFLTDSRYTTQIHKGLFLSHPAKNSWNKISTTDNELLSFLEILLKKSDNIINQTLSITILKRILKYKDNFLRPVTEWTPKSRNPHEQLYSLIRFLFTKYPTPVFLEKYFEREDESNRGKLLYIHMGSGKSLKNYNFNTHINIPNKATQHLYTTPPDSSYFESLRRIQILYMGGDKYIINALMRSGIISNGSNLTKESEEFYLTVMKYFIDYPMIESSKIAEIIDYIQNVKYGQIGVHLPLHPNFSMKDRNPQTLINLSDEWHYQQERIARANRPAKFGSKTVNYTWKPINVQDKTYTKGKHTKYKIRQLLNYFELVEEGKTMHHCVATYGSSCLNGRCSIFTVDEYEDDKLKTKSATIEVRDKVVAQIRGKYNKKPTDTVFDVIKEWSKTESLEINKYAL